MNSQIDVSDILSAIRVPTLVIHRRYDVTINIEGGRYLAENIPGARLVEMSGTDHLPFIGDNAAEILDAIEEFLTGSKKIVVPDRVLATVLFTDIVGSTERAAELGDRRWRDLLDRHNAIVRRNVSRFRGRETNKTGDGFLVKFDRRPRRRCACATTDQIRAILSKYGHGFTRVSAKRSTTILVASPSISAPAWRRLPAQAKSSCTHRQRPMAGSGLLSMRQIFTERRAGQVAGLCC